ncbi:MAG: V-type ATP synthase subunit I, partial [Oscillospiraceae bacterium]|nr:V-type ATP synthase subunit I [Oscillospiraceae bacterium]
MAIVNMKRLRLFGLIRDRDRLFEALQQLGCVEVTEQTDRLSDPDWAGLVHPNSSTRSEKERLLEETEAALKVLDEYAPVKSSLFAPKPEVKMEDLFDQDAAADAALKAHEINAYAADLRQNASDQHKVKTTCQTLLPWVSLDIPLTTQSTASMYVAFGMIPATVDLENVRKDLQLNADASELFLASTDAEMHYLLFCCHRSQEEAALDVLKSYGFSNTTFKGITGTAEETVKYLTKQLATLEQQEASITEALSAYKDARPALQLTADRLSQEIQKELCKERLLDTDTTFFMTGWVSEPEEAELVKTLDSFDCAYELEAPTEEEYPSVPVKLKNGKIATSLNTVTEMYSLPQYGSID